MPSFSQVNENARCPYCKAVTDGASGERRPPEPGDVVICLYCAGVGIYTDELTIRRPTYKEYQEAQADETFQRYMKMIKSFIAANKQ